MIAGHTTSNRTCGPRFASPEEVERAEFGFYAECLRGGHVVADVGAHVGALTMLFSTLVGPAGRVHAFEPGSWAFERLCTVTSAANLCNVNLHNAAMSDVNGQVDFVIYDENHQSWNGLRVRPLESYGIDVRPVGRQTVAAVTLDAFATSHEIPRFDLVKIDVEGAELQVLRGARGLLESQRIGRVVFEFGQTTFDFGNRPDEIAELLADAGYTLRNIVPLDPVFPGGSAAATARFSMHVAEPRV